MNRALLVAITDLRLALRDKTHYVWLVFVPLAFTYFLGFANRGPGSPSNPRPPVLIENADTNFLAAALLREIEAQGIQRVSPTNAAAAERGLRIPADFTTRVLEHRPARAEFFQLAGSSAPSAALVEARLLRAMLQLNAIVIEAAAQDQPLTADTLTALQNRDSPVTLNATFAGRRPLPAGFNMSLPGILVMTLMMNLLIFGGAGLAELRRTGVLRRLLMNPVRRRELILGKIAGLVLLGAVQAGLFILLGQFAFGVDFGPSLPATLATLILYLWVAASLGVLIGGVISREDRIITVCVLGSLVMAAMGGCWWPLEIVPPSMRTAGHFFPTAWAMDALHQMISFGGGLREASTALLALAGFGVVANAAAIRFFRA